MTLPFIHESVAEFFKDPSFTLGLLDALPAGVLLVTRDGAVLYWNPSAEQITGYPADEIGQSDCLLHICDSANGYGLDAPSPVLGRPKRAEIQRKDGRKVTLLLQWTRHNSPAGDPFGLYVFTDVTENVIDEDSVQIVNQMLLEAAQRMQSEANTDGLTGLLNHRAFHERLHQEMSRMKRHGRAVSLIMFDVDFFKRCNDAHGHQFGDRVLKAISDSTQKTCRHEDIIGRYGGEEFVVAMPETSLDGAVTMAERLRENVEAREVREGPVTQRVTISCGVSRMKPEMMDVTPEMASRRLIQQADEALYSAKRGGRNKVVVYEPGMNRSFVEGKI